MLYLIGFLLILASNAIISVANVFDGELSRHTFKSVWSVVILNTLLVIPILPVLFLVLRPGGISTSQTLLLLVISAIEVFYQIPYYTALRYTDTSTVASLFGFGRIFVPVFAYFVANEKLEYLQYAGFAIIVFCSIAASFDKRTFKMNKAVYYMLPLTLILALESTLEKVGLNDLSWNTFYFWNLALTIPFALLPLIVMPTVKKEVFLVIKDPFKKKYIPLYGQNIATWISGGFSTLALSLLPVTIIKAFGSFHSLFVYLVSSKISKRLGVTGENSSSKKLLLFLLMGVGILLALNLGM